MINPNHPDLPSPTHPAVAEGDDNQRLQVAAFNIPGASPSSGAPALPNAECGMRSAETAEAARPPGTLELCDALIGELDRENARLRALLNGSTESRPTDINI